jgi:putative endonuclease
VTVGRQRTGARGEDRAANWYAQRGYQVVERNWRCRDGEIDLIATVGTTLVICEVKARSSLAYGHPAEAVTPAKQRRLRQLAVRWLAEHDLAPRPQEIRFDVAAVLPSSIEVIEAAF